MAIAFDNSDQVSVTWSSSVSGLVLGHTCNGSNRILWAAVETFNGASLITVSGVTYESAPFTKAGSISAALESAHQGVELWYLDNPAGSVSGNVIATFSGTADFAFLDCASYTGKTTTGLDATATAQNTSASTTSPTCNVSVVHSDCWLVAAALSRFAGTVTAGSGTTVRDASSAGHALGDSNGIVGTGNQTLNFVSGTETWPGVVAASFSAANAGGGGGTNVFPALALGCGPSLIIA